MANKPKKKVFSRISLIWFFLEGSCKWFALSVLFSCIVSFLDLINPKIISYTVDSVIGQESEAEDFVGRILSALGGAEYLRENLYVIALLIVGIALFAGLFRYLNKLTNSIGAERMVKHMRDSLFAHIEHLPFSWHSQNHTGDIIQRCTSDVEMIKNFVSEQLTSLIRVIIMIVFALYFMFQIHPMLTLVSAVFFPIIIFYSSFFHGKIGKAFRHADEEEGKLSAIAQENLTGVRVVRAFGRESYERKRFETQNESYTKMWIRLMQILAAFWGSGDLISGLQVMVVTVVGAVFCVQGHITTGEYIAFIYYNSMLTWPVRMLGRVVSELSKAGVSIDRLAYIMNAQPEQPREDALKPPMDKDICFEHVSYSYANGPRVLRDVTFEIKAGSTLGILGGTGAGKSTLMVLLDALYQLPEGDGRITIGGVDIRDIDTRWLRENIGMVLQEPYLFSRTLEENIAISIPGKIDREAVRKAARTASLDENIMHFSKGYDTYVGERGVTLSGGQKQRTAIAQMLMRKPPIMIFDDSLSAVDAQTDAQIRHALQEEAASSTVILIAHRITTLMRADQIVVLDRGHVAQIGTHEQLLAVDGIYRRIYDLQVQQSEV